MYNISLDENQIILCLGKKVHLGENTENMYGQIGIASFTSVSAETSIPKAIIINLRISLNVCGIVIVDFFTTSILRNSNKLFLSYNTYFKINFKKWYKNS